jgi:hypothetical protein
MIPKGNSQTSLPNPDYILEKEITNSRDYKEVFIWKCKYPT